jgi:hypothetical protein
MSKRIACWSLGLLIALVTQASATVITGPDENFIEDVFCDGNYLGSMEIDHYFTYKTGSITQDDIDAGFRGANSSGVRIDGQFDQAQPGHYHYIQVVTVDDDPLAWIDGTPLSAPYVDTPPRGYQNQPFDNFPWYDQSTEFPRFFDQPSTGLLTAKDDPNNSITVEFETWLVCVVSWSADGDQEAADDSYVVAPLLGWEWGYTVTYDGDNPPPGDTLNDFTVTKSPFAWRDSFENGGPGPSAAWLGGIAEVYGTAPNQDSFNIQIGDCENCVPEPATLSVLALGTLVTLRRRRV